MLNNLDINKLNSLMNNDSYCDDETMCLKEEFILNDVVALDKIDEISNISQTNESLNTIDIYELSRTNDNIYKEREDNCWREQWVGENNPIKKKKQPLFKDTSEYSKDS